MSTYSFRNAFIGFTRDACHAGTSHPAIATSDSNTVTIHAHSAVRALLLLAAPSSNQSSRADFSDFFECRGARRAVYIHMRNDAHGVRSNAVGKHITIGQTAREFG